MRYTLAIIDTQPLAEWQVDLLTQQLAEIGFDSFEPTGQFLHAYIPSSLLDEPSLRSLVADYGVTLQKLEECPDEDWNSTWEQEHPVWQLPLGVSITPHGAFGAGHHQTTSMMIDALLRFSPSLFAQPHASVLDMGTGTGVLAIMAAKAGAEQVVAVDIDDSSVRNARENAQSNGVQIDVRLGDSVPEGQYRLIMANIHRNILLAQMADYARALQPEGELWLSGFYEADIPALTQAAQEQGLTLLSSQSNDEWQMLRFSRPAVATSRDSNLPIVNQSSIVNRQLSIVLVLLLAMFSFTACTHRSHLSSRKMVAVLTDIHRVDGMMQISGMYRSRTNEQAAYYESVLAQHGVTRAEFDSSLVWYTHHPQRFNKIYPKVIKNLDAEHALYVGEAEQNRLLLEQRKRHFAWFTPERMISITQQGYMLQDYDLCSYRVSPADTLFVSVPFRE